MSRFFSNVQNQIFIEDIDKELILYYRKFTKIKLRLKINEDFTRLAERMSCCTLHLHVIKLN